MVKNTIKLCRRFFLQKVNKNIQKKTRSEMFCAFAGMTSLTSNLKLHNFITSEKLIKTPQNIVQGSFPVKLTKVYHKNMDEDLASGPL